VKLLKRRKRNNKMKRAVKTFYQFINEEVDQEDKNQAAADFFGSGDPDYAAIEKYTDPTVIAKTIYYAKGYFQDDEAVAEAAFMAIANNPTPKKLFQRVVDEMKRIYGEVEPYGYCVNFMDTSVVHHKRTIDSSMNIINSAAA